MPAEDVQPALADAAARWVAAAGISARVRDARRWDLGVVARILADTADRPPATPEPKVHLRQLRRLHWADLDPPLVSNAVAAFGADHAPSTERRLLATWSSFLGWLADEGYPVPAPGQAGLAVRGRAAGDGPHDVGRLVAEAIRSGRRSRDAWPERDRAMVGVIVAGSLSLANVSVLLVNDVRRDGERTWMRSRSRQGAVRWVDLPPSVGNALDEYLLSRRACVLRSAPDLFVRAGSGKPYTAVTLRYVYVGWFRRAGVDVPREPPPVALRPVYEQMIGDLQSVVDPSPT